MVAWLCILGCEKHSDDSDLLSDKELKTPADPNAPEERPEWIDWIEENHTPIRSLESENFSDLQFLKLLLDEKRIVQLGESGHGVAQFNQAKTRLIKFLHEEMGYDVIAFESGLFECFYSDALIDSHSTAAEVMLQSIFGVWHTEEVKELFDYIIKTHQTDHPLHVSGFDVQMSSFMGSILRPMIIRQTLGSMDKEFAERMAREDSIFVRTYGTSAYNAFLITDRERMISVYDSIESFIDQHAEALENHVSIKNLPGVLKRTAWSMKETIHSHYTAISNMPLAIQIRDNGMADNVDFLLGELYSDKKIMIWAHNFHIRHDQLHVGGTTLDLPTMGYWIAQKHRTELYTIGLYMYRGNAAENNRQIYSIAQAASGSLESILYRSRKKYLYIDLSQQEKINGNGWMFQAIQSKEWGQTDVTMIHQAQYDGILFIYEVTPPVYLNLNSGNRYGPQNLLTE